MVRFLGILLLFFVSGLAIFPLNAQTFNGQGNLPVPPGAPGQTVGITTSTCTVSGVGVLGMGCSALDHITIDFVHTFVGDVALFLIAPTGQVLELSSGNGGAGDNFQVTVFTDNTPLFITQGSPPYNGTFRPEGRQQNTVPPFPNSNPLGTFTFANLFNGLNADGDWTLFINDYVLVDVGLLNSWSMTFTSGGGPSPTVNLGPDITICPGEPTTLVATVVPAATSYIWSTGATTPSINIAPVVTTTYMVTVENNGCMDADTIQVFIDPNGVAANAGPDVTICAGTSATLNGSGGSSGSTYQWSNGQNGQSITVSPNAGTVYTLTVTDGTCTGTDQVFVGVTPSPNANAGPDKSICEGESVSLTATGGMTNNQYQWSSGQSGATISVSPSSNTIYTVTVTVNGCSDTDIVEVEVNPLPVVSLGPDITICDGESIDLDAGNNGSSYQWSTGQSGSTITVAPSATTTFSVTVTQLGCEGTDEITITVGDIHAQILGDDEICSGASTVLTGMGGNTFEWSTGQSGSSILVSPSVTTTYDVTVTQGNCEDEASLTVVVNPTPSPVITPDATICEGQSIDLTVTGGPDYLWSNGSDEDHITVNPVSTTTYSVTVGEGECIAIADVTVDVHPSPHADAGPDLSICNGDVIVLTADGLSGPGTFEWSNGEITSSISDQPLVNTIYAVTITNQFNCTDSDEVQVTVNAIPTVDAGQDVFLLTGESTILSATGNGNFLWSTGETSNQISVSPDTTTTYTITTTLNGCSSTDEVTVYVNQVPAVDLGADQVICEGESITLSAQIAGPFNLQYAWNTGELTSDITVSPLITTKYSVTVTDVVSGFSTEDTIEVTVIPLLTGIPVINGSMTVCFGSMMDYNVNPIPSADTYTWTVPAGASIISGQGSTSIAVDWGVSTGGEVSVVVSNSCNMLPAAIFDVIVNTIPGPVNIVGALDPCNAGSAAYTVAAPDATGYQWSLTGGGIISSGQGTSSINVDWNLSPGGDLCVVLNNDCGASSQICVQVVTSTAPSLSAGTDINVCGLNATLSGSGTGSWTTLSGPGTIQYADLLSPGTDVVASKPGHYILSFVYSENGCMSNDEVDVVFNETPAIANQTEDCNNLNTAYTISFDVLGGVSPYLINGDVFSGVAYTSASLPSGSPYSFTITDANGCVSETIAGQFTCSCTSSAGLMDTKPISACINTQVNGVYLGGATPDGNDKLAFALHDGSFPNGIIAWNTEPVFSFISPMVTEQVYFISAVIGDEGADGWPVSTDPCFVFSPGTPVVFHALPEAVAGEDKVLGCNPDFVLLNGSGSGTGNGIIYSWTSTDGGQFNGSIHNAQVKAVTGGTFILEVRNDETGCAAYDTVSVSKSNLNISQLQILSTPPVCFGECTGSLQLTQTETSWQYDFGDGVFTDQTLYSTACAGLISISIMDTLGCIRDTSISLEAPAAVTVELGPDQSVSLGDSVLLIANSDADLVFYNWFAGDTCITCEEIFVKPEETTSYGISVTDASGCTASDDILITVLFSQDIFIPNVFSPNQDGVNDVMIIGGTHSLLKVNSFEIFDRWGNQVFFAHDFTPDDPASSWDGTFNGEALASGVYVYKIKAEFLNHTAKVFVGDISLLR